MLRLLLLAGLAVGAMEWKALGDGRLELRDGGRAVMVYNSGPLLKTGVPEDRRRCCYIFPVYSPGGVSMLDDFPKDHYHHRGLFWGWPVVETAEGKTDIWMMKGIGHRLVRIVSKKGGELVVENGWFAGEKELVRERVLIRAERAGEFRVELTLTALGGEVTLRGSQEKGKSYGGFSARFAEREGTLIRTSEGEISKDEDLVNHAWAEMSGVYGGRVATLRIASDLPSQWCLRKYGFVGASIPGDKPMTLQPAKPVTLGFTVSVRDGATGR